MLPKQAKVVVSDTVFSNHFRHIRFVGYESDSASRRVLYMVSETSVWLLCPYFPSL